VTLYLFDIDGTLLATGGAGRQALDEAFLQVLGWEDATRGVYIAGSTDDVILRDVARGRGAEIPLAARSHLRTAYLDALGRRLREIDRAKPTPGAHLAVASLRRHGRVAVCTGNWRAGAAAKLAAVGLAELEDGAYSEDAHDRDGLVPVAAARAAAAGPAPRRVVVIGDTPADVRCARAGGALAVDLQFPSLVEALPWLRALR
jgi:phosphoglycolate phosphatase-like HAD superfamily hydrolase